MTAFAGADLPLAISLSIGEPPPLGELNKMGAACIDWLGRILIQDSETGAVHALAM